MEMTIKTTGELEIENWVEYEISKLFEIKSPAKRSIKKYDAGNIPYVSSGSVNNGIVSYLEPKKIKDTETGKMKIEELERGNCITVSPLDGSSFYQDIDFLGRGGAGSAISLLYNIHLTKYNALFVCTIIKKASQRFDYSDALTSDNLRTLKLRLPCIHKQDNTMTDEERKYAVNGFVPDWEGMEKYMKKTEKIAKKKIALFTKKEEY